jgi:5-methylcytosine-specific restriction protein B
VNAAFEQLIDGMAAGTDWPLMGETEQVRTLLDEVFDERAHKSDRDDFQTRVNLQKKDDAASFAGYITAEGNPTSGPYQGTSFVWFPAEVGSVAVLVIGTDGFGADTAILGRPGHARRLRALARAHHGSLWVKPDLLDLSTAVPDAVTGVWPAIPNQLKSYSRYIYAAAPCRSADDSQIVADLLDLFLHEHGVRHKAQAKTEWTERLAVIDRHIFPAVNADQVSGLLRERRFVILEGPPGTGKTMIAREVGETIGSSEMIQFHPARTYEDFVVGLYPRAERNQLEFEVRPGDLLRANDAAKNVEHVLIIDEVNRADLGRVLGEAVTLFEPGEPDRVVILPHETHGHPRQLQLSPTLFVLGTRNTADRSIARIDLAIRRRFAFLSVWPQLSVVQEQGEPLAITTFEDVLRTFVEFADEDGLRLTPGHAYFLDPRPDLDAAGRPQRVARRLLLELVPLLRDYVQERLLGPATAEIAGLADRIEAAVGAGEA